ncbi:MAG: hypothetical protein U0U66_11300 [Cytophagaceae bacterium]
MKLRTYIVFALFFTLGSFNAYSQDSISKSASNKSSQIYIETDPTALFFNGFSLAVRRSSTLAKILNLGLGIYTTKLPDFYIEAEETNKGKGWEGRNMGIDGFIDYYIFNPNKGLSVGLTLSLYKFSIERNNQQTSYHSFIETLRIGYLWRPIKKFDSVYVFPWVGLSTGQKISGNNEIDGETFTTPKWNFVPAFQIGYSF